MHCFTRRGHCQTYIQSVLPNNSILESRDMQSIDFAGVFDHPKEISQLALLVYVRVHMSYLTGS